MPDESEVERGYYVYVHRDAATGVPFYVGKGKDRRAYVTTRRHPDWRAKVKSLENGYEVEIVADDLSEEDAFDLEKELFAKFGKHSEGSGTLVNVTDGGDLYFGEASIVLSLGGLDAGAISEEKAQEYRDLTRDEKRQFADATGDKICEFEYELDSILEEKPGEDCGILETDLEETLSSALAPVSMNVGHFLEREVPFDRLWESLVDAFEDVRDDLERIEEAEEIDESPKVIDLASRARDYLRHQLRSIALNPDASDKGILQ